MKRALAVTILFFVVALALGVSFGTEPRSLASALFDPASMDREIIFDVRLPRVLLGALSGAGLACVGAAFQAVLRNPLAEPYVLGVSGGAALGATLVMAVGVSAAGLAGAVILPGAALLGGLVATALVYGVARDERGPAGTTILLAGVMINSISSSLITFMKSLLPPSRAQHLLRWLVGSIEVPVTPLALPVIAAYVAIGAAVLLRDAARLNLLALGDDSAEALGVEVRALNRRVFLACSCVVGAIVSVTGLIGFVGLVVPHALRRLAGPDHRLLLPLSLALGAALVVGCDLLARVAFRFLHDALPVGAVTALIGGPVFLLLLKRSAKWVG